MKFNFKYLILITLVFMVPLSGNNSPVQLPYKLLLFLFSCYAYIYALNFAITKNGLFKYLSIIILFVFSSNVIGAFLNINTYSFEGGLDLVGFLAVLPIPLMVASVLTTEYRKRILYKLIFFLVVVNFILGLFQLFLGKDIIFGNPPISGRISGLFSWGAPVVGSYVGLVFPLIVYFYIEKRLQFTVALVFMAIVIMLGGNRSMLIVVVFTILTLLLLFSEYRRYSLIFIASISTLLFVTIPLVLAFLPEYFSANLVYRITSLGGDILQEQQTKRIATWIQTLCMISDYPIFGVGIGNYKVVIIDYLNCAINSEGQMPHPHHVYLDIISSQGILGFVLLSILAIGILFLTKRRIKQSSVRIENYMIVLIIFSPLNVTHGLASAWWSFMCFVMLGIAISNIKLSTDSNLRLNSK